jgi:hypothetical protein
MAFVDRADLALAKTTSNKQQGTPSLALCPELVLISSSARNTVRTTHHTSSCSCYFLRAHAVLKAPEKTEGTGRFAQVLTTNKCRGSTRPTGYFHCTCFHCTRLHRASFHCHRFHYHPHPCSVFAVVAAVAAIVPRRRQLYAGSPETRLSPCSHRCDCHCCTRAKALDSTTRIPCELHWHYHLVNSVADMQPGLCSCLGFRERCDDKRPRG